MSTLTHLASRYRWELMLVLVIPFVSGVIGLLLIVPLIALDALLDANILTLMPLSIVQPILLAIFYFRVRALGRTMLTLAWSYSLIILATNAVTDPAFEFFYEEGWFREHVFYWGLWGLGTEVLIPIIVLVWFARRASIISFKHALMLIALSTALNGSGILMPFVPFPTLDGWIFSWETAILNAVLKLFAVWVLARLDTADDPVSMDTEGSEPWECFHFQQLAGFPLDSRVAEARPNSRYVQRGNHRTYSNGRSAGSLLILDKHGFRGPGVDRGHRGLSNATPFVGSRASPDHRSRLRSTCSQAAGRSSDNCTDGNRLSNAQNTFSRKSLRFQQHGAQRRLSPKI